MTRFPNKPPRWERRKESRPAELLAAALAIFVEKGYAATRLDDVAANAGVSKGTLYLYYPSKEDLFKAVVRENIVPKIDAFRQTIEQSQASSEQLLAQFLNSLWQHVGATETAGIIKLIVAEAGNFPEVARFFSEEVIRPNHDLLGSIVARGIAQGEFRAIDIEAAVHVWIAPMVLKAIWMNSLEPADQVCDLISVERIIATQLKLILDAIRVRSPATGGAT